MIKKSGAIQIIDFGYSTILSSEDEVIKSYSGTPVYLAPEIVNHKPFDGKND
jgi:serine/threonine protein kinase